MIKILSGVEASALLSRPAPRADVSGAVTDILRQVREEGDEAVRRCERQFDGVELDALEVSPEEWERGAGAVEPEFLGVLERAAANIRRFHSRQARTGFILAEETGMVLGQRVMPLERVGLYVPGGTAAYPSTVLMNAIPAQVAGCGQILMATPPARDGSIPPALLTAARLAGVSRVFKMGGAQAIGALAYGTDSVTRVDKIVGPGNVYVAEAKRQVFGLVAIDMIAGPSEIFIVADAKNDPAWLAADLLSQAEHDKMAAALMATDSPDLAKAVAAEVERQLPELERRDIARASIEDNGKIIITETIAQAIDLANALAPEHLELCLEDPLAWLGAVRHAGSVFLGRHCPEALGDYCAGPNHTLPTSGTARFSSPLSVDDFLKKSQFIYASGEVMKKMAPDVAVFAHKEGLTAHARSALMRLS